jgi:hypothetical protein
MVLLRGCDWSPEVTVQTQFADSGSRASCRLDLEFSVGGTSGLRGSDVSGNSFMYFTGKDNAPGDPEPTCTRIIVSPTRTGTLGRMCSGVYWKVVLRSAGGSSLLRIGGRRTGEGGRAEDAARGIGSAEHTRERADRGRLPGSREVD